MMRALDAWSAHTLIERIRAGVPFLGICLGLQALFESSDEAPEVSGLGLFPGTSIAFAATPAFPTWAGTKSRRALFPSARKAWARSRIVYFAHSYYAPAKPMQPPRPALTRCPTRPSSNTTTSTACSSIPRSRSHRLCRS